jgi:hypothetical protein
MGNNNGNRAATAAKAATRRKLKAVGRKLAAVEALHDEKVRLLREGKRQGILLREMGDDLGISESAVIKALKRDDARA